MKRGVINPKLFYFVQSKANNECGKKTFEENTLDASKLTEDFYNSIRPLLQFGRIIGIIPITGLWNKSGKLQYKWNTSAAITSVLVTIVLSINVFFSFLNLFRRFAGTGHGNAVDLAFSAKNPLFYLTVLLIYIFFQFKAKELIALFSTWRKVSIDLKLKRCDDKLPRSISILALSIYLSAFFETVLSHLTQFPVLQKNYNDTVPALVIQNQTSPLEVYYLRSHPFWALYVAYCPTLTVLLLICNLISLHAWNYADIIIIAFSRALYFKFKALVESTEKCLVPSVENKTLYKLNGITWTEVRRDHLVLCKLLDDFEAFLSPLIFLSYTINIFFICLQLNEGLTPGSHRTFLDSISSTWSFCHLIFRIMTMSITASKINEYAHQISVPIQKCSSSEYCKEVERLERMLGTGSLGLSGYGCFIITRAFILMVLSVIFTMEIVLLQTSATSGNPKS